MSNELIKTNWVYSVPENSKDYNDFYKGTWKVEKTHGNSVQLSQSESERGDGFYTHSKKNIIIPITQFQQTFKKARVQNIVAEEKYPPKEEPVCVSDKPQPVQRTFPVMTNKDIVKAIEDRKNAWTEDDIETYLKSRGITPRKCGCGSPHDECNERNYKRRTIDEIWNMFDEAFGSDAAQKLLNLLGEKLKTFEPKRPCRYTLEHTDEPRCDSKECKRCKRGMSIF